MKTVLTIKAGRSAVVLRSSGQVYVADAMAPHGVDYDAKLVATTPAGCQALGEALLEMARVMRERDKTI